MMHSDQPAAGEQTINLGGLTLPVKPTVTVILVTLLVMVDYYYNPVNAVLGSVSFTEQVRNSAIERFLLYFVVPLLTIILVYREDPADYGLRVGNWRQGLKWTGIVWACAVPVLFVAGRTPAMVAYYRPFGADMGHLALSVALEFIGWEFVFRGFLLFALLRVAGPSALVLQAVPFALAHLGKPPLETLSTMFGGMLFGWVAWKGDSYIYALLVHWFVMTFTVLVAVTA